MFHPFNMELLYFFITLKITKTRSTIQLNKYIIKQLNPPQLLLQIVSMQDSSFTSQLNETEAILGKHMSKRDCLYFRQQPRTIKALAFHSLHSGLVAWTLSCHHLTRQKHSHVLLISFEFVIDCACVLSRHEQLRHKWDFLKPRE